MDVASLSPVVELRQYTLVPGGRDVLIELFEREFIESQEELGMTVIGQFTDVDDDHRFVWLRGFSNMAVRQQGLAAFYGGPIWNQHRESANATMIDSDNVLLLRPSQPTAGFSPHGFAHPPDSSNKEHRGLVTAAIYAIEPAMEPAFVDYIDTGVRSALGELGAVLLACFVSDHTPNNFPSLPVREGENVIIWFAGFPDASFAVRCIPGNGNLGVAIPPAPLGRRPFQILRLLPTPRSAVTGLSPGWSRIPG